MRFTVFAVLGLALLGAGCHNNAAPTPTPAPASITETFIGTLQVGGVAFYSFVVGQYGTVTVTLNSVTGPNTSSTVSVGMNLGIPAQTSCSSATSATVPAATTPALTTTLDVGTHCVLVDDVGNLTEPVSFNITIAHP